MASTFSTNLALELIGTGDQAGTWGVTTNTNLGTLIEQAISGYVTQAVSTGADTTITIPNGATGVARNMYIELTGTGGTNTNLIVPSNKKLYFIFNNTASGQVTVKVSGQTGVSVQNGKKMVLVCNGTDIVNGLNYIADFGTNSFTVTNLTATSATITNLIATTASVSDLSATVARSASATITNLLATSTTVSSGSTLNGGVVINEPGADVDFRVESDTDANCLFVDASANAVGIGTSSPGYKLDVNGQARLGGSTGLVFGVGTAFAASQAEVYSTSTTPMGLGTTGAAVLRLYTNSTLQATLDTSGNLGLGVTPSAWGGAYKGFQIGQGGLMSRTGGSDVYLLGNNYYDGTNFRYINTTFASRYQQDAGVHSWYTAPSGTAGNTISFTQAMTLDASGQLLLGTTTAISGANIVVGDGSGATATAQYFNAGTGGSALVGRINSSSTWLIGDTFAAIGSGTGLINYVYGANPWIVYTNGTERARITSGGDLLVGTTSSPSYGSKLRVEGGIESFSSQFNVVSGTSTQFELVNRSASAGFDFYVNSGGTLAARITSGGDFGIGTASPGAKIEAVSVNSGTTLGSGEQVIITRNTSTANGARGAAWRMCFGSSTDPSAQIDLINGATGQEGSMSFSTRNSSGTFAERARITSGGDLGVGTASPACRLHVDGQEVRLNASSGPFYSLYAAGTREFYLEASAGAVNLIGTTNKPMVFGTNNTERARITSGGFFGIGTTNPGLRLTVSETAAANTANFVNDSWDWYCIQVHNTDTVNDNLLMQFVTDAGSGRGSITYNRTGGLVAYNTTSDYRAKDIIGPVENSGETIDALQVYMGQMHGATVARPMLIAHEAQAVTPYAVTGEKDAEKEDGTPIYQQMDHSAYVPLLIAEIQSLRARSSALEDKVAALEAK